MRLVIIATIAIAVSYCGKKEDEVKTQSVSGISIIIPDVEPKIRDVTPVGLKPSTSLVLTDEEETNPATAIKSRLFSGTGPTDIFSILEQTAGPAHEKP